MRIGRPDRHVNFAPALGKADFDASFAAGYLQLDVARRS
jgi:hypothetical protein